MKFLKNKKGFTLMELLGAIGIIAILCAISVPLIAKVKKSTDAQQENDYAKSIFLAAQDHLSNMKVDGSIVRLSAEESSYPSVYTEDGGYAEALAEALGGELPDKLKEILGQDTKKEYVYVLGTDENFNEILPENSIDSSIRNRKIVIVFNPTTGDILYVRYGDEGEYYGSVINSQETIGGGTDEDNKPIPKVTLSNGEEYLVKIKLETPEEYQENPQEFYDGLEFKIEVGDTGTGKNCTYTVSASDAFNGKGSNLDISVNYLTGEITWVLDSLCDNSSFMEQMSQAEDKAGIGYVFTGCNVDISITCTGDKSNTVSDRTVTKENINPCFDKIEDGIIYISNGRHLENLNEISESVANKITEIQLSGNISWEETVRYYQNKYADKTTINGTSCKGFMQFKPLDEETSLFNQTSKVVLNGNGRYINCLYVNNQTGAAGLFEKLYIDVKNLTLTDPLIMGGQNAGALAAEAYGATITNCRVKILNDNGRTSDDIRNNFAGVNSDTQIMGVVTLWKPTKDDINTRNSEVSYSAGLLLGTADKNTVIKCDSEDKTVVDTGNITLPVSGQNFGLVVGYAEGTTITSVTVKGNIQGGNATNVGLVAGYVKDVTYTGCHVEGKISGVQTYYTREYKDGKEKNCYAGSVGGVFGRMYKGVLSGQLSNNESSFTFPTESAADDIAVTINKVNAEDIGTIVGYALGEESGGNSTLKIGGIKATGTLTYVDSGDSYGLLNVGSIGRITYGKYVCLRVTTTMDNIQNAHAGGLAGDANNGEYYGLIVNCNAGHAKQNDTDYAIKACYIGGLFGLASDGANVHTHESITTNNINSQTQVNINFINFKNCFALGGAVGQISGGSYSKIYVRGEMLGTPQGDNSYSGGMISEVLGGFVGRLLSGKIAYCHQLLTEIDVEYVWHPDDASDMQSAKSSKTNMELAELAVMGDYAFPSDTGFMGRFVGYARGGTISDCDTRNNTVKVAGERYKKVGDEWIFVTDYRNAEFVGGIYCKNNMAAVNLYKGTKKNTTTNIEATAVSDTETFQSNQDTSLTFTPVGSEVYYTYNVTLTNCAYYFNNSTTTSGKKYLQTIESTQSHYYEKSGATVSGNGFDTDVDITTGVPFLVVANGYILKAEKKTIKGSDIQSLFEQGKVWRDSYWKWQRTHPFDGNDINLWDSEKAMKEEAFSYYYSTEDNKPYEPNETYQEFWDSSSWGYVKLNEYNTSNTNFRIKNTSYDIYRYEVKAVPFTDDLKNKLLNGDTTACAECYWQLVPSGEENGNPVYHMALASSSPAAYVYLDCEDVGNWEQTKMLILPDVDDYMQSDLRVMSGEKGWAIYRTQYISSNDTKCASFKLVDDTSSRKDETKDNIILEKYDNPDEMYADSCPFGTWGKQTTVNKILFNYTNSLTSYKIQ